MSWAIRTGILLLALLAVPTCGGDPGENAPLAPGTRKGADQIDYRVETGGWWRLPIRCSLDAWQAQYVEEGRVGKDEVEFRAVGKAPWMGVRVARTVIEERSFPVWIYGAKPLGYWGHGKRPEEVGTWSREQVLETIRDIRAEKGQRGEMPELERGEETVLEARVEVEMRVTDRSPQGVFELGFESGPPLYKAFRVRVRRRAPGVYRVEAPFGAPCGPMRVDEGLVGVADH